MKKQQQKSSEQAVLVNFKNELKELDDLHELEKKLIKIINDKELGKYDGHGISIGQNEGDLFMYGPDAKLLFDGVKATLEATPFLKGADVTLRFGTIEEKAEEFTFVLK